MNWLAQIRELELRLAVAQKSICQHAPPSPAHPHLARQNLPGRTMPKPALQPQPILNLE